MSGCQRHVHNTSVLEDLGINGEVILDTLRQSPAPSGLKRCDRQQRKSTHQLLELAEELRLLLGGGLGRRAADNLNLRER
jgi:hypothetical protein